MNTLNVNAVAFLVSVVADAIIKVGDSMKTGGVDNAPVVVSIEDVFQNTELTVEELVNLPDGSVVLGTDSYGGQYKYLKATNEKFVQIERYEPLWEQWENQVPYLPTGIRAATAALLDMEVDEEFHSLFDMGVEYAHRKECMDSIVEDEVEAEKEEVYPEAGEIYTYDEICGLSLGDSPFLIFRDNDMDLNIQGDECPMKDLKWRYSRTTSEWIPLFYAVDNAAVAASILAYKDEYGSIMFGWDIPGDCIAMGYSDAIQELVENRDNYRNEVVTCPHCGRGVKRSQLRTWKWYDFYAAQGDEALVLCDECWGEKTHQNRIAKDRADYEWECGVGYL